MYIKKLILFFFFMLLNTSIQAQDTCADNSEDLYRVLFIVDASFSMDRKWNGQSLWDISHKMVEEFSFYLQKNYNVEQGLRVYGHRSPLVANDCFDSHLEIPLGKNNATRIVKKLKSLSFKGATPLAYSLEKAADDLGCNSHKNLIVLITDGYETCNQNPCEVVRKLMDYRISVKPIVIGLNVEQKDIESMNCIGDFYNVKNKEEFKRDLYASFEKVANQRTLSVFLKNINKDTSETNIPMVLFDKKNNAIGSFIHSLAANAKPDTFWIGNFDTISMKVYTKPQLEFKNIPLKKHVHNQIKVETPQGKLNVWYDTAAVNNNSFHDRVEALIYQKEKIVYRGSLPFKVDLLEGNYTLDVLTTPIQSIPITIKPNKYLSQKIEYPASIGISKTFAMIGDIYRYEGKRLRKIGTFQPNRNKEVFYVPKGQYKIVYRSQKAMTLYGTFEKTIKVMPREMISIVL
jgi:Ca-activated chloride channel family protein